MFKAIVDKEKVDLDPRALDPLPPEEKRALHAGRPQVRCCGCGGRAHIRQLDDADNPFMVFAHNPGEVELCRSLGYHTDESAEHNDLKSRLAAAARKAGWSAETEVYAERCRADVVATDPGSGRCRVLEAQLSFVTLRDVRSRTERYMEGFGGKVTWTHTKKRQWANRSKDVEALQVDDEQLAIVIAGVAIDQDGRNAPPTPVEQVVPQILTGQLRYVFDNDFGFYIDLAASQGGGGGDQKNRRSPAPTLERGRAVRECDRLRPAPLDDAVRLRQVAEALFHPETIAKSRAHDRDCDHGPKETCLAEPDPADLQLIWTGRARMARARHAAGVALDRVDQEAIRRMYG